MVLSFEAMFLLNGFGKTFELELLRVRSTMACLLSL